MIDGLFNLLIRSKKQKNLPCEYGKWKFIYGYDQRYCTKCGARQVRNSDYKLVESHCEKLGINTFRNYEK